MQLGDELGERVGRLGEVRDAGVQHVGDVPRRVPLAVAPCAGGKGGVVKGHDVGVLSVIGAYQREWDEMPLASWVT